MLDSTGRREPLGAGRGGASRRDARIKPRPPDTKGRRLYSVHRFGSVNTAFPISANVRPYFSLDGLSPRKNAGVNTVMASTPRIPDPTSATDPPNWMWVLAEPPS